MKGLSMPVQALQCKECDSTYPLDARYVCEHCFGPLEVAYDHSGLDAAEAKRKIQAGPQTIWRYADFLPFAAPPQPGLPVGLTPLQRAPRLAEALGVGEVFVKNDTANPTHSFKDRVVAVALAKAQELGYQVVACASTGNLANAVAAHSAAAGLESYVFIPADLEEQKVLATGVYGTQPRGRARHLRRREPALHRDLRRARLGVRERERAALLRGGVEDDRVRDRRAARLRAAGPGGGADRLGLAVHEDRARVPGVARRGAAARARCPTFNGAQAEGCSPVAQAYRGGPGHLPAGEAGHDRQVARHRQPGGRAVRARPGAALVRARSTP